MSFIKRRVRRLSVVVTVLLVAFLVAIFQFLRAPLPAADVVGPDAPPQGVDLLYFVNPGHHHSLVAYDWDGHRRGSISLPTWVDVSRLQMARDGSNFLIEPLFDGDWLGYFDRLGHTVVETNTASVASAIWADDNRHLCLLAGRELIVTLPGWPDHVTGISSRVYDAPGQLGLVACSVQNDTALLMASVQSESASITVMHVQLSTGKALNEATFPPGANVVVSNDASLVAVGLGPSASTMIYRAPDLTRPAAELDWSFVPMAFSADDRSLLTTFQSGSLAGLQLIDWKSRKQTWHLDQSPNMMGQVLPRPSGGEVAFALADALGGPSGIFIVHRNGTTTDLDHGMPVSW